jgi:hypothetical protein
MRQGHDQKGTVMRRSILTVLVILLTLTMPVSAGIRNGFHEKPYVMYSDNAIFSAADQFAEGCEVFDDQTAVVLKVK